MASSDLETEAAKNMMNLVNNMRSENLLSAEGYRELFVDVAQGEPVNTSKQIQWARTRKRTEDLKVKVYLAGPIMDMDDSQCVGWRDRVTWWLSLFNILAFNPVKQRDYRGRESDASVDWDGIVEGDKQDILESDFVLANVHQASAGTSMEILFAWTHNIPVIVALSGNNLSPWVRYHSEVVVYDVDWAICYIIGKVEGTKDEEEV